MNIPAFNPRQSQTPCPGLGDDTPCSQCGSPLDTGLECTECGGSGTVEQADSAGPDARIGDVDCPHCQGNGTLEAAYEGVLSLSKFWHEKYVALAGKHFFQKRGGEHGPQVGQAGGDAPMPPGQLARFKCETCDGQGFIGVSMDPEVRDEKCPDCKSRGWTAEKLAYSDEDMHLYRAAPGTGAQPVAVPDAWQPIETAPKDGTLIVLGARNGVWLGKYQPVYQSGYTPDNPWSSLLLNHDHMAERYTRPTHWQPLPAAPNSQAKE